MIEALDQRGLLLQGQTVRRAGSIPRKDPVNSFRHLVWAFDPCRHLTNLLDRPFIVDFASARLEFDPEFIEDEGNTLEDFVRSRFDERMDQVMAIYHELIARAGIYLTDLHPQNIKFGRPDSPP